MPLDPQLQDFVDLVNATDGLAVDRTVEEIRTGYAAIRFALGEPEDVACVEDRLIEGPAGGLGLRVYRSAETDGLPVLVYFHGGGMVIGDLDTHDHVCRELANRTGGVVVSVDYRLAPEHPFPASVEDAVCATDWVLAHAAQLGGDARRLAVAGDSAGGTLAALVAHDDAGRGRHAVRAQLLVYPVTDWRPEPDWESRSANGEGYLLTSALMEWFREQWLPIGTEGERISPIELSDVDGLAPAVVVTAQYDPLHDEGVAYHERLRAAGTPSSLLDYEGAVHLFFQLGPVTDIGRRAVDQAAAAVRDLLARR